MQTRACVVFLLLLGIYGGCCVGEEEIEEVDVVFGSQDDDDVSCSRYCDGTYPEHTYPDPEDHSACSRGCRLAAMDALIAWPLPPCLSSCLTTCEEAYGSNDHQLFACKFGCNATTIDQMIPDRDHIYPTGASNMSEVGLVMEVFSVFAKQLPQFILFTDEVTELTEHADKMYQLLPCSGSSTFIYLDEDGEAMEIQYGYSFNGFPSALYESADSEEEDSHSSEMTSYHLSCPWHYSTAGKLLFFASVGLIAIAVCACSCSIFSPEEREGPRREKVSIELVGGEVYALKSPLVFSPGYPQPVPYYVSKN